MFSKDDARTVLGIIGNIISMILFLSPLATFYRIWKKKSVEQYSALPYLATLGNCMLWVLYGVPEVHPHSILVVTINGAGVAIEALYLLIFVIYSDYKKRVRVVVTVVVECIFMGVLALAVLTLAHTTKLRSTIVGSIAMIGNIAMYASPLSVMKLVITTRSVEYMPFFLSLFSFLNGICWTAYALIRFDPFIVAPNGMGALLGLAQIVLYATFYKSTKATMAQQHELALSQKQLPQPQPQPHPHPHPHTNI